MLNKIRGKHSKKVLWIIAAAVIAAFVLSNASSYLDKKETDVVAEIGNQKITISNFQHYIDLARLEFILYTNLNNEKKEITSEAITEKAGIYYRLLRKVKEEGIDVGDEEVVIWINRNFSRGGKFDQAAYQQYIQHISRNFGLTLTMRSFEEYVRELILVDKLWDKVLNIEITDEEVKALYAMENQKAKIAYLFIPYEKFRVDVGIQPNEIEAFYRDNNTMFQREPTVNIKYARITEEDNMSFEEVNNLAKLKTLDELKEKTSLEIKETGFIKEGDSIKEAGWKQEITQIAFSLAINQISVPIDLGGDFIIVGKEDERPTFIPSLGEIEDEVKEALIFARAKDETKRFSEDLLGEINQKRSENFSKFANKKNIEFKETDFFKYYDYIEGIGLNNMVSAIVFSLNKDEIYSQIVVLDKGVYILKLKDKTEIDAIDFQEKRKEYYSKIEERKLFIGRLKFINQLNQEITIKMPSLK